METQELAENDVVQCQAWRGATSLSALKVKEDEEEEEEGREEQEEQEAAASVNMRCLLACIANISAIETKKKVCLGKKKVWINNRVSKFQMTLEHKALNDPCSGGLRVLPVKVHQHFCHLNKTSFAKRFHCSTFTLIHEHECVLSLQVVKWRTDH